MSRNIETVQHIYAAFGRGDIPAILDALTDDISWEDGAPDPGVPWLKPGTGKAHVAAFFQSLSALDFKGFEVRNLLVGGDQVAAVIGLHAVVKATDRTIQDDELHVWTFNAEGKVCRFRHFLDTRLHHEALTGA